MAHAKDLLTYYAPPSPEEKVYKRMMLDFISLHPNAFQRSCIVGHFTASAWIVNQDFNKALLTHHRKLDKWIQLGGHCDGDSHLIRVANKEVEEESGLKSPLMLSPDVFDIDIHLIPSRPQEPAHYHYDVRFLFQAHDSTPLVINHESKKLAWVDLDSIETLTKEDSVLRMARKSRSLCTTFVT